MKMQGPCLKIHCQDGDSGTLNSSECGALGDGLNCLAVKLAPGGEGRRLAAGSGLGVRRVLPEYRPLSLPPTPMEPNGVSGMLGDKGPGDQQREAQGQEMRAKCVAHHYIRTVFP